MLLSWSDNLKVVCDEHMIANQFICQVIDEYQGNKGPKIPGVHQFIRYFALEVAARFHYKISFRWRLYPPEKSRSSLLLSS